MNLVIKKGLLVFAILSAFILVSVGQNKVKVQNIFDGKTLKGWEGDPDIWKVENGAIVGGSTKEILKQNYFLTTKIGYGDFNLKLKFKVISIEGFVNGGVQFHSQHVEEPPNEMSGYQADIGPGWWGVLYDESRRNVPLAVPDSAVIAKIVRTDDWNDYEIVAVGGKIKFYLNGTEIINYEENDKTIPQEGLIGLQVHGGGKLLIMYKEIRIRDLRTEK